MDIKKLKSKRKWLILLLLLITGGGGLYYYLNKNKQEPVTIEQVAVKEEVIIDNVVDTVDDPEIVIVETKVEIVAPTASKKITKEVKKEEKDNLGLESSKDNLMLETGASQENIIDNQKSVITAKYVTKKQSEGNEYLVFELSNSFKISGNDYPVGSIIMGKIEQGNNRNVINTGYIGYSIDNLNVIDFKVIYKKDYKPGVPVDITKNEIVIINL